MIKNNVEILKSADKLPLSHAQTRLWFVHCYEGPSATYNMPLVLDLAGQVSVDAIEAAIKDVVSRHEVLRTIYATSNGAPCQYILESHSAKTHLHFEYIEEENEMLVDKQLIDAANYPIDLENELPIRATLFKLKEKKYTLIVLIHHIASDGFSLNLIAEDLAKAYACRYDAKAPNWTPLPIQYGDYVFWQNELLGEKDDPNSLQSQQMAYWKKELEGCPEVINLPLDRARPAKASHRGAAHKIALSATLHKQLKALARPEKGLTLSMVMQSALAIVLTKMGAGTDIPLGCGIAGRTDPELEKLIGFFVNTWVLRVDTSNDPTFDTLLEQVREKALLAYENQDLPFDALVDELSPNRSASFNPLFQVNLTLQNNSKADFALRGCQVTSRDIFNPISRFDLFFSLIEEQDAQGEATGIHGIIEYATDLFNETTIAAMSEYFSHILTLAAQNPALRLSEFELLTQTQHKQIVAMTHGPELAVEDESIIQSFARAVLAYPDRCAIVDGDFSLTYKQLDEHANQLAHMISETGEIGRAIGIYQTRSVNYVCSVLAILKVGAAYLPLDVMYPEQRVRHMIKDAAIKLVLTDSENESGMVFEDISFVNVDRKDIANFPTSSSTHWRHAALNDAAYIMYTSGSTGQPKGVVITQQNVVHFANDPDMKQPSCERVLMHASTSFDASTYEMWIPLLNGGCVVMGPTGRIDVTKLAQVLEQQRISGVFLTSTLFSVIAEQQPKCLEHVHTVWTGGDKCSSIAVTKVQAACPNTLIGNVYGPTETTTFASTHLMREKVLSNSFIPIGIPMGNTQLLVLDDQLRCVPIGVPGQLYIAGTGLARGYLNNPKMTAEHFIANPYGEPGSRMYMTGDLVKWRADGLIEYLERIDRQVKIRGFRIELGEIEQKLRQYSLIGEAVVETREKEPGNHKIIAYVVRNQITADSKSSIQSGSSHNEQVEEWHTLYESLYEEESQTEFKEDFRGWNSSYTDLPIPDKEMRVWLEGTFTRVASLNPTRLLEIGVGSGLILWKIAPRCDEYWGTDFSSYAIDNLKKKLELEPLQDTQVKLSCQPGSDFSRIPTGYFDTIVINSVIQYFPNLEYLESVICEAMKALKPGGKLFIGDVRNLTLLPSFATSQALRKGSCDDAQSLINQLMLVERELLIAPEYFLQLKERLEEVAGVNIQLKRGQFDNELSQHRYEVVIYKQGAQVVSCDQVASLQWEPKTHRLQDLPNLIDAIPQEQVKIAGIPNRRLAKELQAQHLHQCGHTKDAAQVIINDVEPSEALDPELVCLEAEKLGYYAEVTWNLDSGCELFDLIVDKSNLSGGRALTDQCCAANASTNRAVTFANNPNLSGDNKALINELSTFLSQRLPEYMLPTNIMVLDSLPLTANGKLNRKLLPKPSLIAKDFVAPRNETEEVLADIFSQVLGLESVSVVDSFFDLGGDSILTIRLKSLAEKAGLRLEVSDLFTHQNVAELASLVELNSDETTLKCSDFELISLNDRQRLPNTIEDAYPLTQMQMGMFYHNKYNASSKLYHEVFRSTIALPCEQESIEQAFSYLSMRHEILRTSVNFDDYSEPLQLVHKTVTVPVRMHNLSHLSDAEQEAWLDGEQLMEVKRCFDKDVKSLLRVAAYQLSARKFILNLCFHHAILDGWSHASLITEFVDFYKLLLRKKKIDKPNLDSKFRDYVKLELQAQHNQASQMFWEKYLAEFEPAPMPKLNGRVQHSQQQSTSNEIHSEVSISEDVGARLNLVAKECHVPLKTVLLAAHLVSLGAITGVCDVATAYVIHGRPETEDGVKQLGLFLNSVPFRVTLKPTAWNELITHVSNIEQEIYHHRRFPLTHIMRIAELQKVPDVAFNYTNFHVLDEFSEDDLVTTGKGIGDTSFGLKVNFESNGEAVHCLLSGHINDYDQNTLQKYAHCFSAVIEHLSKHHQEEIQFPSLLSEYERQQLLSWGSDTTYNDQLDVVDLIEQQAIANPHHTALICGDEHICFENLHLRAKVLAQHLRKFNIGVGKRVAIYLPRSNNLIISMLAVMQVGAAYLPLEVDYPEERLSQILDDAGAVLCISNELSAYTSNRDIGVITPEGLVLQDINIQEAPSSFEGQCEDPCYIIYTSGTTGKPKGVVNTRGNLANFVSTAAKNLNFVPKDKMLCRLSVSFDAAVAETWLPLVNGVTVNILPPEYTRDFEKTLSYARETHTTMAVFVPSMISGFLELNGRGIFRHIIFGGEALHSTPLSHLMESWQLESTSNLYGPTETTVAVTEEFIDRNCEHSPDKYIPIGKPYANASIYILNDRLQPVPIGVPGDLYIAGPGVASGYLGRPELTASKFVANPFVNDGSRMYCSGDIAKWNDSGVVEFISRADHQIKIRGHRVETGEVEAQLLNLPQVSQALVRDYQKSDTITGLLGYVILEDSKGVEESALRDLLSNSLPDYMLPDSIFVVPYWPTSVNGKVDVDKLPTPNRKLIDIQGPRNDLEAMLCNMYCEILELDRVDINENFFDLGGDSICATRLVSRVRALTSSELPIEVLYQNSSVALFAKYIKSGDEFNHNRVLSPLRISGEEAPLFCFPPAGNLAWSYAGLLGNLKIDCPVYGLQIPNEQPVLEREYCFDKLVSFFITEIRKVQPNGPYRLLGWSFGGLLAQSIASEFSRIGEDISYLGLIDAYPQKLRKEPSGTGEVSKQSMIVSSINQLLSGLGVKQRVEPSSSNLFCDIRRLKKIGVMTEAEFNLTEKMLRSFETVESYMSNYSPYNFTGDMTLFRAVQSLKEFDVKGEAWEQYIDGSITYHDIEANHYDILSGPFRNYIANLISDSLNE